MRHQQLYKDKPIIKVFNYTATPLHLDAFYEVFSKQN